MLRKFRLRLARNSMPVNKLAQKALPEKQVIFKRGYLRLLFSWFCFCLFRRLFTFAFNRLFRFFDDFRVDLSNIVCYDIAPKGFSSSLPWVSRIKSDSTTQYNLSTASAVNVRSHGNAISV
jgi:hypothetical protein